MTTGVGGRGNAWGAIEARQRQKTEATKVADHAYVVEGFVNTSMVVTDEGNVVIDTARKRLAPIHRGILKSVSDNPVKFIILTHGHFDHRGGIPVWKEPGTRVIAQEKYIELIDYLYQLHDFFARRASSQFGYQGSGQEFDDAAPEHYGATEFFDRYYRFELGGITFELFHTPGDSYDGCTIWLPESGIAFVGDNYMRSFPNIYTLRGARPRWALDYVYSLDKVLSLEPEVVVSGHSPPLIGRETIQQALRDYRDAILYVHDETVRGMNEGKDVHTLMREVRLPEEFEIRQSYGTVAWSVRGIYEGYAGWFDGNPVNMYSTPVQAVYPDLVEMAGGTDAVARRAQTMLRSENPVEALHMADIVLAAEADHRLALEVRLEALSSLDRGAENLNEKGWLNYGIQQVREILGSD